MYRSKFPIIVLLILFLSGCQSKPAEELFDVSEAEQKFVKLLKEENNVDVITRQFDNSMWIFLPFNNSIFQMKASPKGPQYAERSTAKPVIKFLDGKFQDGKFKIKYDIQPSKEYAKDYGYTSSFSDEYTTKQRNILTAIYRIFTGTEDPPTIYILISADIKNGIMVKNYIHLGDLKKIFTDETYREEQVKRIVSSQPEGNINLIGDTSGANIEYTDFTLPQFLIAQMVHRINFKYSQSAFPPSIDTRDELLNIAADTVSGYDFTEFDSVELNDLNAQSAFNISPEDLVKYKSQSSEGRLIHIKFQ